MIGLMVVGVIVGYIFLAKFIVTKVYEKTQSLKKKYIALAIVILIPTWDAILGLPIYMYLCKYHAGVKIYQTVENVEGFYVGEQDKAKESITLPYKGYNFVDYKDEKDGKYYRNSWLDNNTSERCISYKGAWNPDYTKAFEQGKCIVKEEIAESKVSQWENRGYRMKIFEIPILNIKQEKLFYIKDRHSNIILGEVDDIWWDVGYVAGNVFTGWNSSMEPKGLNYMDGKFSYEDVLKKILKPKGDK
ncbi:hypothetical protein SJPD1_2116 [Sulfurospirillum diekertiae]|uniref:Uncharacterized protein n=1 Tax=Sulfurospirillum diekertiae TaxID=1854492 RepID=A0A290HFP4_9BACT|nr:hypothetical protein [Sulfurospirillum diekertiae]ATB70215.1 hypothetical protein SJPD1_2116 [Sulfurospirillum diekertiae]